MSEPSSARVSLLRQIFRPLGALAFLPLRAWASLGLRLRVEGRQNVPARGPFIVCINENSILCMFIEGMVMSDVLRAAMRARKMMNFAAEEFWAFPILARGLNAVGRTLPLVPHGAGMYGLNLLDALDNLKQDGIVVMNPEGDTSKDGRPITLRDGVVWLALHTGAPILPLIVDMGAYDVLPSWQTTPNLRGRVKVTIGQPFTVTDAPNDKPSSADIAAANVRLRTEIDSLAFGPGGEDGWTGRAMLNGAHVDAELVLESVRPSFAAQPDDALPPLDTPIRKRGMELLVWRCPLCRANDALRHTRGRVACRACKTEWRVTRQHAKDFRLCVTRGKPELVGFEMSLARWYDEMWRDFEPVPRASAGAPRVLDLAPDERIFLATEGIRLLVYRTSALANGWTGRTPPSREVRRVAGGTKDMGAGRLVLTNLRLAWDGAVGGLDFDWPRVTAVNTNLYNQLILNFGATPFRFMFARENAFKWLAYAGWFAQRAARAHGKRVTLGNLPKSSGLME